MRNRGIIMFSLASLVAAGIACAETPTPPPTPLPPQATVCERLAAQFEQQYPLDAAHLMGMYNFSVISNGCSPKGLETLRESLLTSTETYRILQEMEGRGCFVGDLKSRYLREIEEDEIKLCEFLYGLLPVPLLDLRNAFVGTTSSGRPVTIFDGVFIGISLATMYPDPTDILNAVARGKGILRLGDDVFFSSGRYLYRYSHLEISQVEIDEVERLLLTALDGSDVIVNVGPGYSMKVGPLFELAGIKKPPKLFYYGLEPNPDVLRMLRQQPHAAAIYGEGNYVLLRRPFHNGEVLPRNILLFSVNPSGSGLSSLLSERVVAADYSKVYVLNTSSVLGGYAAGILPDYVNDAIEATDAVLGITARGLPLNGLLINYPDYKNFSRILFECELPTAIRKIGGYSVSVRRLTPEEAMMLGTPFSIEHARRGVPLYLFQINP